MKDELEKFLKYVMEVHTDKYGQLEICESGNHLDPTIKRVVEEYLKTLKSE